jgi:hypothetical protein
MTPSKEYNSLLGVRYADFEGFLHHYLNLDFKEKLWTNIKDISKPYHE